jgi:hypothetical protein
LSEGGGGWAGLSCRGGFEDFVELLETIPTREIFLLLARLLPSLCTVLADVSGPPLPSLQQTTWAPPPASYPPVPPVRPSPPYCLTRFLNRWLMFLKGLERLARTEVAEGVVSVVQERFSENLDVGHHNLSISDVEKAVFL